MYTEDILSVNDKPIVWSSFRQMWKTHFSNVIIPKVSAQDSSYTLSNPALQLWAAI